MLLVPFTYLNVISVGQVILSFLSLRAQSSLTSLVACFAWTEIRAYELNVTEPQNVHLMPFGLRWHRRVIRGLAPLIETNPKTTRGRVTTQEVEQLRSYN